MSDHYDIAIIGAGPGGYVAAIRAAQLGLKSVVIDRRSSLGGTCLNVGCIPSKALLQSSHRYHQAGSEFADHGIQLGTLGLDLELMMQRKDSVVNQTTKGIEYLFRKNKIAFIQGEARILSDHAIAVSLLNSGKDNDKAEITADHIIIATGSVPMMLPGVVIDESVVVTSTGALTLSQVPQHLVVIGGGYIGLEIGSIWRRLGAKVTIIEFKTRITDALDHDLSQLLYKELLAQGIEFLLGARIVGVERVEDAAVLTLEPAAGGEKATVEADVVLVAIGRKPATDGLGLEALGIARDSRGAIIVDEEFRTSVPTIRAIGDAIPGPMLAHKASEEGIAVIELIAGKTAHINYDTIPAVVYTSPEVATVGRTEEQLVAENISFKLGRIPFTASGRARANGNSTGFVKILVDGHSDRILGAHIIGDDAGTMISELVLAMEFGASSEDLALTCHPHPTLSETIKEAAMAVDKRAIHF